MRQAFPADVRAKALAVYLESGPAEASRQTGVPRGTVSQWALRNGVTSNAPERMALMHKMAVLTREQRIDQLADDLLAIATERAKRLRSAITADTEREMATVMGIAIDKSQLLTGNATSRTEMLEPAAAGTRIRELQEQWRQRHVA